MKSGWFLALAIFAGGLCAAPARSSTLTDLAGLYVKGDWGHFFAQSYLYRLELQRKIQQQHSVSEVELSPLVLESIAYFRRCQFAMSARLVEVAGHLLQNVSAPASELRADIGYLRELHSAHHRTALPLARAEALPDTPPVDERLRWIVRSTENTVRDPALRRRVLTRVDNACAELTGAATQ